MEFPWNKTLLIQPKDLQPSLEDWEIVGTFNPAATVIDGAVLLVVRVAERPREKRPGLIASPRWDSHQRCTVDWFPAADIEVVDPRVIRIRSTGLVRLTFLSYLLVIECGDGVSPNFARTRRFEPLAEREEYGVEDPRITRIGDTYWMTYVAVSKHGAATALASTVDFQHFERHGIIFPPENKDVVLFPEAIDGRFFALHRPNGATPFTKPEMWLACSPDLIHWGQHEPLVIPGADWQSGRVGAGTPPIRTSAGWLEIYHGNRRPTGLGEVGCYQAAAMVLDADHPARIVRNIAEPIMTPTEDFESQGFVPNVIFPTGIVEREDSVLVYYGASDTYTAVAKISQIDLATSLAQ